MALEGADKIFANVDDEINFLIEKVLATSKQRVILVVPQNALVISSLVSLKMLSQQVLKSEKLVILVTEDQFAQQLALRANLIAVEKVSNITPEQWEAAQIKKEAIKSALEQRKEELLVERGSVAKEKAKFVEEEEPDDKEAAKKAARAEALAELSENSEGVEGADGAVEEDLKLPIQRVRRQPKMVQAGKFSVLAGGDILAMQQQNRANIDADPDMDEDSSNNLSQRPRPAFTGRDWTKATTKTGFSWRWPWERGPRRREVGILSEADVRPWWQNRWLWVGATVILGGLLAAIYVLAFVVNSIDLQLVLKQAEIPVEGKITATTEATSVDIASLTIPAQQSVETVNGSDSGTASGSSTRGQKAGGLIEIWNMKVGEQVTIPAGTAITNPSSGLKYLLTEEAVIPAATEDGGIVQPGIADKEWRIEAENFGPDYNIPSDSTVVDLQVGSYPLTGDGRVVGKRFKAITGGTTEAFTSVSQEDVDGIKTKLSERLMKQGKDKLKSLVRDGYIILGGTEEFEEKKITSVPAVGAEATRFDVSLEGEVSVLVVQKKDLEAAVNALVQKNQQEGINFIISSSGEQTLSDIEKIAGGVTFNVSSSGSLKSDIDVNAIKQAIAGKTSDQAKEYLSQIPELERFVLQFSPELLPNFLRFVPWDTNRIKATVE